MTLLYVDDIYLRVKHPEVLQHHKFPSWFVNIEKCTWDQGNYVLVDSMTLDFNQNERLP